MVSRQITVNSALSSIECQLVPLFTTSTAVLVTAATLTATIIVILLPTFVQQQLPGCHDARCLDYREDLLLSMHFGADPCQDFFQHVCANFPSIYPNSHSFIDAVNIRIRESRNSALMSYPLPLLNTIHTWPIVAFRRCMMEYEEDTSDNYALGKVLNYLRLYWSSPEAPVETSEVVNVILSLSLDFAMPTIIRVDVIPDLLTGNGSLLQLEVEDLPMAEDNKRSVIEDVLREAAYNITEIRFNELSRAVHETYKQVTLVTDRVVRESQVPEYIEDLVRWPWFRSVLNERFKAIFTRKGHVFTTRAAGVSEVLDVVRKVNSSNLMNFIRYLVAREFFAVASTKLIDTFRLSEEDAYMYRFSSCAEAVLKLLPIVTERTLFYDTLDDDDVSASTSLVSTVLNQEPISSWLDNATRVAAIERLRQLRIVMGLMPGFSTVKDMEHYYQYVHRPDFDYDGGSAVYFAEWVAETRGRQAASVIQAFEKQRGRLPGSYSADVAANAIYDPLHHYIQVLPGLIFPPFRASALCDSFNYGNLGSTIAHLIARSVDPIMGVYNATGLLHEWHSEQSLNNYDATERCLADSLAAYEGTAPVTVPAYDLLASLTGLRIAYNALTELPRAKKDTSFAAYTLEQQFFIAACFRFCGVLEPRNETGATPLDARCNVPLKNMPEFAKAFRCGLETPMHSSKCVF